MASSTAIIALLVVARNHIESITQQICAKPCSKANPRDFRNPALLEMSQRYAITQTKSQLFLNFTHLRTTNAIGYQRFDLEKSGHKFTGWAEAIGEIGRRRFRDQAFCYCLRFTALLLLQNLCHTRKFVPESRRQTDDLAPKTATSTNTPSGPPLERVLATPPLRRRSRYPRRLACRAGRRRLGRRAYRRLLRRGRPCRRMRWLTRRSRWWSRPPPCRSRCSRRRSRRSRCLR